MSGSQKPTLSILERLTLVAKLLSIAPLKVALNSLRFLFQSIRHNLVFRLYVICAGARMSLGTLTGRELQYISPSTRQVYGAWIKKKAGLNKDPVLDDKLVRDVQSLAGGDSAILWLGNRRKASKIVLFFHGGGYVSPCQPAHLDWCWNSYVLAGADAGVDVAVAFLQYTLAPGGQFPVQLREAAEALSTVLNAGFLPKDIIIGGDSAGGNLTMQLLGHILHPHPEARPIEIEHPLFAAFLVSPWISCNVTSQSFRDHGSHDLLSAKIVQHLSRQSFGEVGFRKACAGNNSWAAPMDADESWLQGVGNLVKSMYVTVGRREVLCDQGIAFAERVERLGDGKNVDVRLDIMEKAAHDFVLLEAWAGQVGESTLKMQEWFKGVLSKEQ